MFSVIHQAKETRLAHAAQHLARHATVFFPLGGKGFDLFGNKACDLVAQQFVFGGDEDVVHMSVSFLMVGGTALHPEHTELRLANRLVQGRRKPQRQHAAGISRINHAIIPKAGA